MGRWATPTVAGKSVEVQRSQVDDLFKSLKSGDELIETEPRAFPPLPLKKKKLDVVIHAYPYDSLAPEIVTTLYPHQKKALTFLLEREREISNREGKSSLWQTRPNPFSGQTSWFHVVTQKEVYEEPPDCKGAILADDVCTKF